MAYISALLGKLGKGKTSFAVSRILEMKKLHPWAPIASTVPIALPGPFTLFMCRSAADYVAFSLVVSRFVYSEEGRLVSNTIRSKARRRLLGVEGLERRMLSIIEANAAHYSLVVSTVAGFEQLPTLDRAAILMFANLQAEYSRVAASIDPMDKTAMDAWIAAHNLRVLHNRLADNLDSLGDEAHALARHGTDFYHIARHILDDFRFDFAPPSMPFHLFLDETGVSASSTENADLRRSAFYDFLAQLRKFGGTVAWATHEPGLAFKQMRDITDMYWSLWSTDLPLGRLYLVRGYRSVSDWERQERVRGLEVAFIRYPEMGRYPTGWIVQPPPRLAATDEEKPKRR